MKRPYGYNILALRSFIGGTIFTHADVCKLLAKIAGGSKKDHAERAGELIKWALLNSIIYRIKNSRRYMFAEDIGEDERECLDFEGL